MGAVVKIGINIGFTHVKTASHDREAILKSLAGKRSTFLMPLSPLNGGYSFLSPAFFAGDMAEDYSNNPARHQHYDWIHTPEFYHLFLAAISDYCALPDTQAVIAVSLPPNYYLQGRDALKTLLQASHVFHREGREPQTATVLRCYVVPEAFAAVCDELMDDTGNLVKSDIGKGDVACIDIGGKTSHFILLRGLKEREHHSATEEFGCWDVVAALKKILKAKYGRELTDFQADTALREGQMWHETGMLPLAAAIADAKQAILPRIISTIRRLWDSNTLSGLRAAYIVGGGAQYIGKDVLSLFPNAAISRRPIFANAYGLKKYVEYAEKGAAGA